MQPRIIWAQTSEVLLLTIEVPETKDACVDTFDDVEKGISLLCVDEDSQEVHIRLELFKIVDKMKNEIRSTPRNIQVQLVKREEGVWDRLLFDKSSYGNIAVDWDKWAPEDEDEEEDLQDAMPPDFDMSSLANMANMGSGLEMPEADNDDNDTHDDDTEVDTEVDEES